MDTVSTFPATGQRHAVLNMPAEEFRMAGHELIDALADFLQQLPGGKVTKGLSPSEIKKLIQAVDPLPLTGANANELLKETTALITQNSLLNGHP